MDIGLPFIDLIKVSGTESLGKNYNIGMIQAKYKIKAFIHEDVDMLDGDWVFKLIKIFSGVNPPGLVGCVGTKLQGDGFWWETGPQHIHGSLLSGFEKAIWNFNPIIDYEEAECVDGFFMATTTYIKFDERFKFHCYDLDYSREMRKAGEKVVIMNHVTHHIGEIRTTIGVDEQLNKYKEKWANII